jgi:hypothetical protein
MWSSTSIARASSLFPVTPSLDSPLTLPQYHEQSLWNRQICRGTSLGEFVSRMPLSFPLVFTHISLVDSRQVHSPGSFPPSSKPDEQDAIYSVNSSSETSTMTRWRPHSAKRGEVWVGCYSRMTFPKDLPKSMAFPIELLLCCAIWILYVYNSYPFNRIPLQYNRYQCWTR